MTIIFWYTPSIISFVVPFRTVRGTVVGGCECESSGAGECRGAGFQADGVLMARFLYKGDKKERV